jgi:hypothetical protein
MTACLRTGIGGARLMSRLFEHRDWSRFDSPETDAPSFLSDSFDPLPFEPVRDKFR